MMEGGYRILKPMLFSWRQASTTRVCVSHDGQRFLINVEEPSTTPITVILDWKANDIAR